MISKKAAIISVIIIGIISIAAIFLLPEDSKIPTCIEWLTAIPILLYFIGRKKKDSE